MASIQLENLHHSYSSEKNGGGFSIDDLTITWQDGTANALLGPSGCGKTTLLNIMSGLLQPTGGRVLFNGKDITKQSPRERHISQVFQFPVVYDGMSVFDNLAFPLRNSGVSAAAIRPRVHDIAEILGLTEILTRRARNLTPADKQKVSLGRGIVREDTAAVLLDEPLTVIDPKVKWNLRRSLREVQRALKMTMIYVTHDQHEALTFADQVTVMKDGEVMQTGTPHELHANPTTPFVGFFIGSPGMNILEAQHSDSGLNIGTHVIPQPESLSSQLPASGGPFKLGIRPEFVEVSESRCADSLPCTIRVIEDTGAYKILSLTDGDLNLKARVREHFRGREDDTVWVRFSEEHMKIFPS